MASENMDAPVNMPGPAALSPYQAGAPALTGLGITGSSPELLVGWLNDLVRHVAAEHTASAVAGYFDPGSRVLTWAQAGHPPPVLVRGNWARPVDPPSGILLGAGNAPYE